jgi:hypothetical protein
VLVGLVHADTRVLPGAGIGLPMCSVAKAGGHRVPSVSGARPFHCILLHRPLVPHDHASGFASINTAAIRD